MMGQKTFVAFVGVLFLASAALAQQAKPGAAAAQKPAEPAAAAKPPMKFVSPLKGDGEVEFLPPVVKSQGAELIVTTIRVKNTSSAPLVGFKVEEFWYDAKGTPVTGAQPYRHTKPMMPGEIIEVKLTVPRHAAMKNNMYLFAHANGKIKPKRVTKFSS